MTRLAAAEAAATSADEEVVCEGEKTREKRDAELRVARRRGRVAGRVRQCRWTILGVCVARCAARELARASVKRAPVKAGAWRGKSFGLVGFALEKLVKVGRAARDSTKMVKVAELP